MIVTQYLQAFQVKYHIKMSGEDLYFKILQKSCFLCFFRSSLSKKMFIESVQINGHCYFIWLIVFVSFSDDEFVIGPCRSTATHDNDRK